jgi:hypothetical protein
MIAVFYDRKNKREVFSYQLTAIRLVQHIMVVDAGEGVTNPCVSEQLLSDIGYKSAGCPKHQNWDIHCLESDLVFLRLIDEPVRE